MTDLPNADPESRAETLMAAPDKIAKVRELFGVDSYMEVPAFSEADERVPDLDPSYVFDPNTTLAPLKADPTKIPPFPNLAAPTTAPFGQYFSLDGVHPSALAHKVIANALIDVINTKYGTSLAPVP